MKKTRSSYWSVPFLWIFVLAAAAAAGVAQPSPYAGFTEREIKALSEEEMEAYQAGTGMGLALAAELNGYPGPRHVLELAAELELDESEIGRTEQVFGAMQEEAVRLGTEIIERERHLDRLFAAGTISEAELRSHVAAIARLQGQLRLAHLQAHLQMARVLTPAQVDAYRRLRGYGTGHPPGPHPGHHGGHGSTP